MESIIATTLYADTVEVLHHAMIQKDTPRDEIPRGIENPSGV